MTSRAPTGSSGRWCALALAVALGTSARLAAAEPTRVAAPALRGWVEATSSRWSAGGDMIVTDVIVHGADGSRITVTEPGGSVNGLGMSVSHRTTFVPGDEVVLVPERGGLRAQRVSAHGTRSVLRAAPADGDDTAHAGLQRASRSGRALYHPSGCLSFVYDARGSARIEGEWATFDAAFTAWEDASATHACGGVQFQRELVADAPDGRDGINTIRFRDDTWCRPASGTEPEICHSPSAVAVTRVLYVDDPLSLRDGEILEVDIEVNTVDFTFASDGRASAIDLQSAAAHEIGHALGLDHNCGVEDGAWPTDENGTPVPSCESASPELVDATMYVQVQPGTVTMRSPDPSDLAGLCTAVGSSCVGELTGGCSASGSSSGGPALLTGLAGLVLGRIRRRRR